MPHIKDFKGKRAHMIGIGGSSMSGLAGRNTLNTSLFMFFCVASSIMLIR